MRQAQNANQFGKQRMRSYSWGTKKKGRLRLGETASISPCVRIDVASRKEDVWGQPRGKRWQPTLKNSKAKIIAQMLPPHNRHIPELARESGIPQDTLYAWRGGHRPKAEGA